MRDTKKPFPILLLILGALLFGVGYNFGFRSALKEIRPAVEANSVKLKELEERQAKVREACADRIKPSMPTFCVDGFGRVGPCPNALEVEP